MGKHCKFKELANLCLVDARPERTWRDKITALCVKLMAVDFEMPIRSWSNTLGDLIGCYGCLIEDDGTKANSSLNLRNSIPVAVDDVDEDRSKGNG